MVCFRRFRSRAYVGLLVLTSSFWACNGVDRQLQVHGRRAYVRCLAGEPLLARTWRSGGLSLEIDGRTLAVHTARKVYRIAAFRGPAPGDVDFAHVAKRLASVDLVVVLGNIGDSEPAAERTLKALAKLPAVSLVLAGGRDDARAWKSAFEDLSGEERERVLDVTTLRRVKFPHWDVVVVAGGPPDASTRNDYACGYSHDDLVDVAHEVKRWGERPRVLLSWAAPAESGPFSTSSGLEGVEAGDPALGRFAREARAFGGIHAWPTTQAGRASRGGGTARPTPGAFDWLLRASVPSVSKASPSRSDGSWSSASPLRMEVSDEGLRIVGP